MAFLSVINPNAMLLNRFPYFISYGRLHSYAYEYTRNIFATPSLLVPAQLLNNGRLPRTTEPVSVSWKAHRLCMIQTLLVQRSVDLHLWDRMGKNGTRVTGISVARFMSIRREHAANANIRRCSLIEAFVLCTPMGAVLNKCLIVRSRKKTGFKMATNSDHQETAGPLTKIDWWLYATALDSCGYGRQLKNAI